MRTRLRDEWRHIAKLISLRDAGFPDPVSQLVELRRQLPSLYLLLIINVTAVSYTHHGLAPFVLTVTLPAVLNGICAARAVHWLRSRHLPTRAEALGSLRRVAALSFAIALLFIVWAICLDRYGGGYEQGHVAFFIAVTVIGCIFCLTHLPQAALLVAATVLGPYVVYYSLTRRAVFIAMAINFALVTLVIGQVMIRNFQAFVALRRSRQELAGEQAQSRALSAENARLANVDSLTGLPNRRAFFARLDSCLAAANGTEATFALLLIDLDGFKPINDGYGHVVGDQVLVEVGRLLTSLCEQNVVAARLGGDEFGLIVVGDAAPDGLERLGRKICETLSASLPIDGLNVACRASCGIAIHTTAIATSADLYDRADFALYDAKANRRGGAVLYGDQHEKRLRAERAVEAALLAADLNRDTDVRFRPILDLESGLDHGLEAIAAWRSPALSGLEPERLARAAAKTGVARRLVPILLRKAIGEMAGQPDGSRLYVRLAASDVMSAETTIAIMGAVRRSGLDPARITLQIAETSLMRDAALAARHLATLKGLGVRIALDDFGDGHSGLSCLRHFPLDEVMLHRDFARDLATEPKARDMMRSALELCRTLGLTCIAKGVDDPVHRDAVAELGGRYVQASQPRPDIRVERTVLRLPVGVAEPMPKMRLSA